jgi:two-component system, chemotaxis family, response regulator PixG
MSSVPLREIYQELIACQNNQFTGKFNITSSFSRSWNLHFFLGKLVGDSGGMHPLRRWLRQTARYCTNLTVDARKIYSCEEVKEGNYEPNKNLLAKGSIVREEALNLANGSIIEILFEIFAEENKVDANTERILNYSLIPQAVNLTDVPLVWVKLESLWQEAETIWQDWCRKGLRQYSPNLVPQIVNPTRLQQLVSPLAFTRLTQLIDGKHTLRDLAITVKQEVSALTASLLIYIQEDLMNLVEVGDLDFSQESLASSLIKHTTLASETSRISNSAIDREKKKFLIAHIDDNPLDIQIMGQIIREAGHDYVNVQNPMLSISTLLKEVPDLIFLDLVMPVANGYEVCAQLRRISLFQETPIIILTSSDGIVDRVRAKMVNSTAFINKPIEQDKVLSTLFRYLPDLVPSS